MVLLFSGAMARVLKILSDSVCVCCCWQRVIGRNGVMFWSLAPTGLTITAIRYSLSLSLPSYFKFQLNGSRHECNEQGCQYFVVGLQLSVLLDQIAAAVILAHELGATLVMPTIRESLKEPGRYVCPFLRLIFSCR